MYNVDENGSYIPFNHQFCYLGSYIDFMLNYITDIKLRLEKANKSVRAFSFIWNADSISIDSKIKLYLAIPVNLALWNCKLWSGNIVVLKALDTFHHKSVRRILHILISQVKVEKLTNKHIRTKFSNIKQLSEIWRSRLLLFMGRASRQPSLKLSFQAITATIPGKRLTGRPFRTNKDAIVESIRKLIPCTPHYENTDYWIEYTTDEVNWERIVKNLGHKTYRKYLASNNNNHNNNN